MPLNMHQVQDVSQRAHGLRHGRDRADLRGVSPLMRSSPGSISSHTVSYGDGAGADIEEDYVHLQMCNSCNQVRLLHLTFLTRTATTATLTHAVLFSPLSASGTNALIVHPNLRRSTWYVTITSLIHRLSSDSVLGLRTQVIQSP